ncbi:hypothetical protein DYB25_013739 [Aphanomyces astaci]|uniref:Uncharacterized protein n=1 Tax=Aphanomyces astaci TaxID=112090 RepID=A0A397BYI6_APHAT|nr:hypothetical protein DYB25_013739 [Aphanomyces astaci]RHY84283.1 hypothetical protein DYB26_002496 [Aphanomyces astaci]RHZ30140.1 hypothetical protein DYB31_010765 [Aphanomyces astaci]
MARPSKAGKSAKWTDKLDAEFVVLYAEAAAKSVYVASGGKQLKSKGWSDLIVRLGGRGNITNASQLQSRWKRLKEDYVDYKWLMLKFSGDGLVGVSEDSWGELDKHPRSMPLSRFRERPFLHYDAIAEIVGDAMAIGEYIRGIPTAGAEMAASGVFDMSEPDVLSFSVAQKRRKLINDSMKQKRIERDEESAASLAIKQKNSDTLASMCATMQMMTKILAAKNNLQHLLDNDE